jgi:hypothetical protein
VAFGSTAFFLYFVGSNVELLVEPEPVVAVAAPPVLAAVVLVGAAAIAVLVGAPAAAPVVLVAAGAVVGVASPPQAASTIEPITSNAAGNIPFLDLVIFTFLLNALSSSTRRQRSIPQPVRN